MKTSNEPELKFIGDLTRFDFTSNPHGVTHLLCTGGSLSFLLDHVRYNICQRDYVILTAGTLPSDFHLSEDCKTIAVSFPDSIVDRETIKNSYGVIGHLSLLQNPVIKLSEDDFISCRDDLLRLHVKLKKPHLFKEEVIGTLLKAHVLDLYNIHAQTQPEFTEGGRPAVLLRDFIGMLLEGKFREHRTIEYYANRLCVNPHYLTDYAADTPISPLLTGYIVSRYANCLLSWLIRHLLLTI